MKAINPFGAHLVSALKLSNKVGPPQTTSHGASALSLAILGKAICVSISPLLQGSNVMLRVFTLITTLAVTAPVAGQFEFHGENPEIQLQLLEAFSELLGQIRSQEEPINIDAFQLWGDCEAMDLLVYLNDDAKAEVGLTIEDVEANVLSRLRPARLYDPSQGAFLHVSIETVGNSYTISVDYNKMVVDSSALQMSFAPTWQSGNFGGHGYDAGFILSTLSRMIDKFINEYLRVNEAGCS